MFDGFNWLPIIGYYLTYPIRIVGVVPSQDGEVFALFQVQMVAAKMSSTKGCYQSAVCGLLADL